MAGKTASLKTAQGHEFSVYVSGSAQSHRAILILHEWWGLKPHNRDWADRLADLGYLVLVVDLYDGRLTDDPEEAGRWMRELDQTRADAKLRAAVNYLNSPARRIATYGCSFGGKEAMITSLLEPDAVSAIVVAYCRMETEVAKLRRLKGPVLAIYAERERNWPDKQRDFEAAMEQAGKITESVSYDAAHGFTNPTSPRYDAEADRAAWEVTVDFLNRHL
jgi:carboxymethylenebutenolidase